MDSNAISLTDRTSKKAAGTSWIDPSLRLSRSTTAATITTEKNTTFGIQSVSDGEPDIAAIVARAKRVIRRTGGSTGTSKSKSIRELEEAVSITTILSQYIHELRMLSGRMRARPWLKSYPVRWLRDRP